MAETKKVLFNADTGGTVKDTDVMAYREEGVSGDWTRNHLFSVMKTYFQGAEVTANTAYKDRVKIKVLWSGPLSVVGVPTNLNGDEKFSDWDIILLKVNLGSDVGLFDETDSLVLPTFGKYFFYTDLGAFSVTRLSDTSFQITNKSIGAGNISAFYGVSL